MIIGFLLHYTLKNLQVQRLDFSDLTEKFYNEFKDYLFSTNSFKKRQTPLAKNSAVSYFNKFKSFKQAYKDGFCNMT